MRAARVRKTWDDWWSARLVSGSANLVRVAPSVIALRSLVAGDPLYGDAPAYSMELIGLLDNLLDNVPR